MTREILAIASCRVSSNEQLLNNSLNRQREAVLQAAQRLGAIIPEEGWWSGSVSSKRGGNVHRKDLNEMLAYCKKHKVKYLIVDEPDRFMRSMKEAMYFTVEFDKLGVRIWYASDDSLNGEDAYAQMHQTMKYIAAESSNDERQRKSINGQVQALKEGRYTFNPKPGYMKGSQAGVHVQHPVRAPILQRILKDVAAFRISPTQGLIEFNKSDFMASGHSLYKMDKFRKIVTDPYYAGILEMDKQVKYRNEHGLHEPLITTHEHETLVVIMAGKKKLQSGPRKNGNPQFPLNNIMSHVTCLDGKSHGRAVGFNGRNGKPNSKIYPKYRCRTCRLSMQRTDVHTQVISQVSRYELTDKALRELQAALEATWKRQEAQTIQETARLRTQATALREKISQSTDAAIDPSNESIKEDILKNIATMKSKLGGLEQQAATLLHSAEADREEFMRFALDFVQDMATNFLTIDPEDRERCKQILFPAGFLFDDNKKVYTPEISPIYRLRTTKKSTEVLKDSHMVRVRGL